MIVGVGRGEGGGGGRRARLLAGRVEMGNRRKIRSKIRNGAGHGGGFPAAAGVLVAAHAAGRSTS